MLNDMKPVITTTDRQRIESEISQLRDLPAPYLGHLGEVEQRLRQSSEVPPAEVKPDVITMNSRFVAQDTHTGETATFTLVYRSKDSGIDGSVSVLTPLGVSFLGAQVGDVVEWGFRRGVRRLLIEKMLYQPEGAGDWEF